MKQRNILIGVGLLAVAYWLYKKSNKATQKPVQKQRQPQQQDEMVSQYNIIPLPDLKNYRFQTIAPTTIMGNTSTTTPVIIAMPTM